jgi:hypothetical protein
LKCPIILVGFCFVMLSGCAANIPLPDDASTRRKLASDLGIAEAEIQSYTRCLAGKSRGAAISVRLDCVYLRTPQWAAVLDYDVRTKRFARAFTFDRTTLGAAMQTRATIYGSARQLQIRLKDEAALIVEFVTQDPLRIRMATEVLTAYEHLQSIGIPVMSPLPFVDAPQPPRIIYIPVYVPSR